MSSQVSAENIVTEPGPEARSSSGLKKKTSNKSFFRSPFYKKTEFQRKNQILGREGSLQSLRTADPTIGFYARSKKYSLVEIPVIAEQSPANNNHEAVETAATDKVLEKKKNKTKKILSRQSSTNSETSN